MRKSSGIRLSSITVLTIYLLLLFILQSCQYGKTHEQNRMNKTPADVISLQPKKNSNIKIRFGKEIKPPDISQEQGITAVREVSSFLTGRTKTLNLSQQLRMGENPAIVFISASDGRSPAVVSAGFAENPGTAVSDAVGGLAGLYADKDKPEWVRLDFVSDIQPLSDLSSLRFEEKDMNLYGIGVMGREDAALLPPELLSFDLIDQNGKLKIDKLVRILSEKPLRENNANDNSSGEKQEYFRFQTVSFFSDGKTSYPLYRGHRMWTDLTPEDVLQSAVSGGKYLTNAVQSNGKFDYIYYNYLDRVSGDYNILRHAGTVYSMLELYEITGDEKLLAAARKGIKYLLSFVISFRTKHGIISTVIFREKIFLGANAVTVLALAKYTAVTKDRRYLLKAQNISRWMLHTMDEKGDFRIHVQDFPGGKIHDKVTLYYPGEAIFALTRLYQVDGDPVWLKAAEKAARFQIETYFTIKREDKIEVDHWLIFACNELYKHSKKAEYVNFSLKLADIIVKTQWKQSDIPDWTGGFYDPPRCTPTATRMEGLLAAYEIAAESGKKEKLKAYYDSIIAGVKFQLQSQIRPETAMFMKKPEKAMGGFMRTLTGPDVRIDYNQHNISSLAGLYKIMKKQ